MRKNQHNTQPNEEALIQMAKDLLANKQYDELLVWINGLLELEEQDLYYRIRAIAKVYKSYEAPGEASEYLTAFDDIHKALDLNYSEKNLLLKHWILGSAIDYYHNSGLFLPLFEYTVDHIQDDLLVRDSSLNDVDNISRLPLGIYITDHKENYKARIQVLNELIELTNKTEYYEKRVYDHKEQNNLLPAFEDINKIIEIEPTASRYMLKADIEIAVNHLEDALQSSDLAYKHGASQVEYLGKKLSIYKRLKRYDDALFVLDQLLKLEGWSQSNLIDKFLLLYNLKRYQEALIVLDDMIEFSPPQAVNPDDFLAPQISNSFAMKLDVLLNMEDYDAYSRLIKSFLAQNLDISLIYYLSILIKKKQYHVILNHFQSEKEHYPVVKWFLICAFIALDKKIKASCIIRQINSEEICKATEGWYNIWNHNADIVGLQIHRADSIAMLCESLELKRMSFLLFLELMLAITNSHLKNSVQIADQVDSANHVLNKEIDNTGMTPGDSDFICIEEDLAEYCYDESSFWNLPNINSIISDMKSEPTYIDGTDRLMPELRAKQRLLKGLNHWEELPPATQELLLGIERELTKIIDFQSIKKINEAKEEERNRILSSLSHSIKNTLRSIIDPLIILKREIPQKEKLLSDAIRGAGLIRQMVTAINASTDAKIEDTIWDIDHPNEESLSLMEMIYRSLTVSLGNMFDSRNYAPQHEKYFPRRLTKGEYRDICAEWEAAVSAVSIQPVIDFTVRHMAHIQLDLSYAADYVIGNQKGSAIKLLILFQELIFNAVKYASDVERENRNIKIVLSKINDTLIFDVENSYDPGRLPKTTGMGRILINNFARILETKPVITSDGSTYRVTLEFVNLWSKHE